MPLDHFTISVPQSKFETMISFLAQSLEHMGFKEHMRPVSWVVGMGESRPYLWIAALEDGDEKLAQESDLLSKQHIAFTAENGDQVRQFHAAALKAGGTCNGTPGFRNHYHPGYYAAFVKDPVCGLNFEVVCHNGEGES